MADRGVSAAGRATKEQPAASAGAALRVIIADGLLDHGDALVALVAGNGLAVNALGLLAEEFDERRAIGDFTLGFGQWFALLGCQDRAQIVLVLHHQIEPFAQHGCALFTGPCGPFFLCGFGLRNGARNLSARQIGDFCHYIAARWVRDVESAIVAIGPFAADKGACFQ